MLRSGPKSWSVPSKARLQPTRTYRPMSRKALGAQTKVRT
jgi:hypothetical protein